MIEGKVDKQNKAMSGSVSIGTARRILMCW